MKSLALALLFLAFDASAACRLQFLGGSELTMRANEGRMERVVQVRLTCDNETQGVFMVETVNQKSSWGRDIVSVSVAGHDMRSPLDVTATKDGTIIELFVSSPLHKYSEVGSETASFSLRFVY